MKRYRMEGTDTAAWWEAIEDPNGEWIKYSYFEARQADDDKAFAMGCDVIDVQKTEIAQLKASYAALEKQRNELAFLISGLDGMLFDHSTWNPELTARLRAFIKREVERITK